jgi:hypothetical protein
MNIRSLMLLACVGLVGTAAPSTAAQRYGPGDLVIAAFTMPDMRLYRVTPPASTYTTVAAGFGYHHGITLAADNTDLFVNDNRFVRVTPGGMVSTIIPGPYYDGFSLTMDEDGRILQSGHIGLESIDSTTGSSRTIARSVGVASVALDRETGDYLVGSSSQVWRIRRDGTITTIVPFPADRLLFHPGTGDLLGANDQTIFRLDRQYRVTTVVPQVGPANVIPLSMAVLTNGNLAVTHAAAQPVTEYDVQGRQIGQLYTGPLFYRWGMVVADSRRVWGLNAAQVGGTFQLSIRFGAHPNKVYVAGAALAPRPGIPVAGNRMIPLSPDALFFMVPAWPTVFSGFRGVLDTSGSARATVNIPAAVGLRGVRVFYAAVVIDAAAPGGIAAVSQTFGATIQ